MSRGPLNIFAEDSLSGLTNKEFTMSTQTLYLILYNDDPNLTQREHYVFLFLSEYFNDDGYINLDSEDLIDRIKPSITIVKAVCRSLENKGYLFPDCLCDGYKINLEKLEENFRVLQTFCVKSWDK